MRFAPVAVLLLGLHLCSLARAEAPGPELKGRLPFGGIHNAGDGRFLYPHHPNQVLEWDLEKGTVTDVQEWVGPNRTPLGGVIAVAVSPGRRYLAFSDKQAANWLHVFDLATRRRLPLRATQTLPEFLLFDDSGARLAVVSRDYKAWRCEIVVYSLPDGRVLYQRVIPYFYALFPTGLSGVFQENGLLLASGRNLVEFPFSGTNERVTPLVSEDDWISSFVLSADLRHIAVGSGNGRVLVIERMTRQISRELVALPAIDALFPVEVRLSPDGNTLYWQNAVTGQVSFARPWVGVPSATPAIVNVPNTVRSSHFATMPGGRIAFSQDNRLLVRNLAAVPNMAPPAVKAEEAWDDLKATARKADEAIGKLVANPTVVLDLMKEKGWRDVPALDSRELRRQILRQGSDLFAEREAARREILAMGLEDRRFGGHQVVLALDSYGEDAVVERARRSTSLAREIRETPWSAETLRELRLIFVLEQIGTRDAADWLSRLLRDNRWSARSEQALHSLQRMGYLWPEVVPRTGLGFRAYMNRNREFPH